MKVKLTKRVRYGGQRHFSGEEIEVDPTTALEVVAKAAGTALPEPEPVPEPEPEKAPEKKAPVKRKATPRKRAPAKKE